MGQGARKQDAANKRGTRSRTTVLTEESGETAQKKQGQRDGGINKRDGEQEREAEGTSRTRRQRKDKGQGKILQ